VRQIACRQNNGTLRKLTTRTMLPARTQGRKAQHQKITTTRDRSAPAGTIVPAFEVLDAVQKTYTAE
jgi:hypothetical protein